MSGEEQAEEQPKKLRIVISGEYTVDDAKRIQQAFSDGILARFGATRIEIMPVEEAEKVKASWQMRENRGIVPGDEPPSNSRA